MATDPRNTISEAGTGRVGYSHPDHRGAWWIVMEQNPPAEELPSLYRAILDRVAALEAGGERAEAARVRATATRIYSRAWDERARKGLIALLRDTTPLPPAGEPTPARGVRTGSVATS